MGCWILVDQPVGRIEQAQIFWHLDVYPTRPEAEKAKGPRGTVVESLGKVWLLTIERAGWRPAPKGKRIAEIGPLPVIPGESYSRSVYGGDPQSWDDISHPHSLGTRSLVHTGR